MNSFKALETIQEEYKRYVFSFQRFKNPTIQDWVDERVKEGALLWKDPHLQLNRSFKKGDSLEKLVEEGLLHRDVLGVFTVEAGDVSSRTIKPHMHQSEAVRAILGKNKNTIVSTGTGSGKSFCFGIPIVSTCMEMRDQGMKGIKAIIVYPMNALANSQYEEFARRLHGTGLKIALYTGDTETSPDEALRAYRETTGRETPWDSEIISREAIQENPPDILMTNYVMLDLIFSRFEDKSLFPPEHRGVLKYLILDEIHTHTGHRGADVACLIRRVKQRTGTTGTVRCIGTSATVQAGEGEDGAEIVARFANDLFGEPFERENVVGETYEERIRQTGTILSAEPRVTEEDLKSFEPDFESARELLSVLIGKPVSDASTPTDLGDILSQTRPLNFIINELTESSVSLGELTEKYMAEVRPGVSFHDCKNEILAALLIGTIAAERGEETKPVIIPKMHAFFSQGRTISSCLTEEEPHLNDRGETVCPDCAKRNKERVTFPLNFCRACGQEFYGATLLEDGTLLPRDIDTDVIVGESIYIYPGHHNEKEQPYPGDWYKNDTDLKDRVKNSIPINTEYCPECNKINPPEDECFGHTKREVAIIPRPFLFCPKCGVYYDRTIKKEFSKLFTFGSVGRSTATDVLVSAMLEQLPEKEKKIIAFSDNRQDTALQAAHMNDLQKRIHFRRGLYQALLAQNGTLEIEETGSKIFNVFDDAGVMPKYSKTESKFMSDTAAEKAFRKYLTYNTLQELRTTQHKNQQNLEDVGLIRVSYRGIDKLTSADEIWSRIPEVARLSPGERQDFLQGFFDIFRKQQAIQHESINNFLNFESETIDKLNEASLFHIARYGSSSNVGYSDTANTETRNATVRKITGARSRLVQWIKNVMTLETERANEIALEMVELLTEPEVGYLVRHRVKWCGDLYMIPASAIVLEACEESTHKVCKKCGAIYHFKHLNKCIKPGCSDLEDKDLSDNYFRKIYTKDFDEAVKIEAEEHSGQIDGNTRKDIENRFKDPDSSLNTIICTPTMELGIDIGDLSAIYMRNVPPSPSNYAQRSGRAGRKSQSSMIATFCGVGARRGPHDQYFYKNPDKIISGKITPPRFMLDNKKLIRAHLHSLIIEEIDTKLPAKPREILDIDSEEGIPIFESVKADIRRKINADRDKIVDSVRNAFTDEMEEYPWFDEDFVLNAIDNFIEEINNAFDYWRTEYENLLRELNLINKKGERESIPKSMSIRRGAIEGKREAMREGKKDFSTYNYLRSQGFLPSYGFPTSYATLSLSDVEDDLMRDKVLALREFAPGNTIYFKNQKYTIKRARPRTKEHKPMMEAVLICPKCDSVFLGSKAKNLAACPNCGASFEIHHPNLNAMELPDMYGSKKERITSDEEERVRLGYNISIHYEKGSHVESYTVDAGTSSFKITYEHNGNIIVINRGTTKTDDDGQDSGFVFCNACNEWLFGKKADKHLTKGVNKGECPRNATEEDIIRGIYLFTRDLHDVVTLDIPLPDDIPQDQREAFYLSVKEAILQGIQISLNIEENEIKGIVKPNPEKPGEYRITIFEQTEGGVGVVKALTDKNRLRDIFLRAREILHEGEEEGCKKACYECLLSYYNQIEHALLNRHLALSFLTKYSSFEIKLDEGEDRLKELRDKCETGFERSILEKIVELNLQIPDEGQKIIYDKNAIPIAKPDFFYKPNIAIFIDGPDHDKAHVKKADETKRDKLRAIGYTVVSIKKIEQITDLKKYV